MIDDWLDFAWTAISGATAFVCLFEGSRRMGVHGVQRGAATMAALAAAFYLVYASLAYLKYQDLKKRLEAVQQSLFVAQPAVEASAKSSPEKREASSLARARLAFEETGTLGVYFDRAGKRRPFVPTADDIGRRERVVVNLVEMNAAARTSFFEALMWLVTGLLAAGFGYAFSREKTSG